MHRILIAITVVCLAATTAAAQTKISGTAQCGKPDPQHVIPVGDRPDHNLGVEQFKCTWTKPMEIDGAKSTEGMSTATNDVNGNTIRTRGFHVATMDGGDKFFVWYLGAGEAKDGVFQGQKGTWGFTGGSGKLKGIKGRTPAPRRVMSSPAKSKANTSSQNSHPFSASIPYRGPLL